MLLSSNLLLVLVMLILLTGVLCPFAQALSFYQVFHLFSTRVLSEIFLTPCSIHSIITEAVYCDFIKYFLILSCSYSIPFLFNRSAAQIISVLFLLYLVLTGVVSIFILPSTSRLSQGSLFLFLNGLF